MYIIIILSNHIGGLYSTKNGLRFEINYRKKWNKLTNQKN